jgi:PAS domain S-box-containing protein
MTEFDSIAQILLQFSPDALIAVDRGGIIRYLNDTARLMFGYTHQELVGCSMVKLIPARLRERHGTHVANFLREPSNREMGARLLDLSALRADDSEFPAGIRLAPFACDGHEYVAVAIRDMTERREINAALVTARQEAERANQAKSRFLATASHDLRQPMHAIRLLNASMLKLTHETRHLHELLRRQEQAIDNATRLLHSLLDISRLESGAVAPKLAPVSLASIFADLQREFEATAAVHDIELKFADTSAMLMTDRALFTQLLQNLVGNAVKYTKTGFVRISLLLDGDSAVVLVEDSGIGIPADKLDRIFDEYYQVDPAGTPRQGVGLGLAIVREVSRLLGIMVAVTSRVGEGTRVRLRMSRSVLLSQSQSLALVDAKNPLPTTPQVSKGRLMLLEDNHAVRMATELFLTLEGYETVSAASAAEALTRFANLRQGDVFVSDFNLDGRLSGYDVLQKLRAEKNQEIPAILLSGDLESMLRVIKTPISCCRFLSKPVDTRALLAAIAELGAGQA